MSDLERIKIHQFGKHTYYTNTQKTILEIQNTILQTTQIQVTVKKFQPPILIISTNSASAASELSLVQYSLLKQLEKYNISQISIVIS